MFRKGPKFSPGKKVFNTANIVGLSYKIKEDTWEKASRCFMSCTQKRTRVYVRNFNFL